MFGILPQGVRITESFQDFEKAVLLEPKPIKNWPERFGKLASMALNKGLCEGADKKKTVLVANGGAGRITLELLRACEDLEIKHADDTAVHFR